MRRKNLGQAVGASSYPGRGIVIGKSQDGKAAFFAYFIMGRSENSRNRVFVEYGDELRAEPFDFTKVKDPTLILYSPVKRVGSDIVVTNGDQTDTIERSLKAGHCFRHALMQRTFEPDPPHFTPRISGILHFGKRVKDFSYELSILKSEDGRGKKCLRNFFVYEPSNGTGHYLHTYLRDGNPLPSFAGEPERVRLGNQIEEFGEEIWTHLDPSNKIALYCCSVSLSTGETHTVLYNIHGPKKQIVPTNKSE